MAPMVFGVPKVIPGVFFMALGLGGYWLFGLSRLRGWTLIAIFVLSLALFLYGVRLMWAWLADRQAALKELLPGEVLKSRPWLRVPAWRRREIVFGSPVSTIFLSLAYLFFGAPAVFFLWLGIADPPTRSGESLRPVLLVGLMLGFIVVGLTYWRLRHWRYGNSVCRLITLPGRLGGWLKADVECALPQGAEDTVVVRLKNMESRGRSVAELWRMEQRMAVPVHGDRTVVNVRLQIPRARGQKVLPPDAGALARFAAPWWVLEVEKKVSGIDFLAQFGVPVYDVPEMPEAPAPAPTLQPVRASASDPARWMAALITVAGAAALVAITYQASRIGWLSTSIMAPSADWMTRERYQREFDVWSMSHYPPAIEGRCADGREEYRSDWQSIPPHTRFMAWYSLTRRDYERKSIEYAASGYTLESTTQYTDCAGVAKFQATWLKG